MIAYAGSLFGGWVYEDHRMDTAAVFALPLSTIFGRRGLTNLSYALTTLCFGLDAHAARVVSLLWHLGNGLLVWRLVRRMVTPSTALWTAGVFLLWPIQVEAVAGVAYRTELVTATFLLLALWAAEQGRLVLAFGCACATVLGKEAGLIALALVPLWCSWVGPRWTRRQGIAWGVACVVPLLLGLWWAWSLHLQMLAGPSAIAVSLGTLTRLIGRALWSVVDPRVLSIVYDNRGLTPMQHIALVGFVVPFYGFGSVWMQRAIAWSAVALSLRVLAPLPELHDRHLYAAWIVVSLALGCLVDEGALWISRMCSKNTRGPCTALMGQP